ncbi:MAG: protease complex subunit PrcB family protein [Candidatus Bathyarchaeota archaeon]
MKRTLWIAVASIIMIVALIGILYYFSSWSPFSSGKEIRLEVNNLTAFTDGRVSFNVSLNQGESGILETVVLNDTCYSWSDGSPEDPSIFKGVTKHWSVNVGSLVNGSTIQVVVKAPSTSRSSNVTVKSSPSGVPEPNKPVYIYDSYGGVGLFDEGIHIVATSQNPCSILEDFPIVNDYWKMLQDHETTQATNQDFITILLARGDKPTGGYAINVESFGGLESYPVKFGFHVNFTNPGEGLMVSQALTNPTVLVPIGKLAPGEYNIEVYVTMFILNVDQEGNTVYTPIMTFAAIVWKQTLTVSSTEGSTSSTTFKVTLNGNEDSDLTVQVDANDVLTEAEAKQIAEAGFIKALGEVVLRRLDTLVYDDQQITVHYTWGYNENDMGHILDLTADLASLEITINHCR